VEREQRWTEDASHTSAQIIAGIFFCVVQTPLKKFPQCLPGFPRFCKVAQDLTWNHPATNHAIAILGQLLWKKQSLGQTSIQYREIDACSDGEVEAAPEAWVNFEQQVSASRRVLFPFKHRYPLPTKGFK
jgi:hypothetical protein